MFRLIVLVCSLLVAVNGCNFRYTGVADTECDDDNNCVFGCHKGYCWSQCNGACSIANVIGTSDCIDCDFKEWCWLTGGDGGYTSCTTIEHCRDIRNNNCSGRCSV